MRAVFSLARRLSPCVVFIDEIDSLFGARMSSRETGGALAHRGVITEFMSEMDGLRSGSNRSASTDPSDPSDSSESPGTEEKDRVIVIGATNRPFDLDDAVLRRLPRRLLVDLPGEKERKEILRILLREENLSSDVDLGEMAKRTGDFSGSDLKRMFLIYPNLRTNADDSWSPLDLSVAAALDAVKEGVILPWGTAKESAEDASLEQAVVTESDVKVSDELVTVAESTTSPASEETTPNNAPPRRVITLANFEKALKEITPSSSESLGTLSELRKWNDEFGEGKREKKRNMWGKGSFGFIEKGEGAGEVRVAASGGGSVGVTKSRENS